MRGLSHWHSQPAILIYHRLRKKRHDLFLLLAPSGGALLTGESD
jgi:hypothetical protein